MALVEDKENMAPLPPSTHGLEGSSPIKASPRKARSKSIGPGGLNDSSDTLNIDTKDRRKSAFIPAMKGIIPSKEDTERKAARRKSMANRRVSFAPEATLHTWDVVEYMRDHTTSTESSESTRRTSSMSKASTNDSSPFAGPSPNSPSSPSDSDTSSTAADDDLPYTDYRRSSGVPPMNFNNPDDLLSSSGISGSSDVSDSDDEAEMDVDGDAGTAMSLDMEVNTLKSMAESESSSTSSSALLNVNLKAAAEIAGTRGIDFDEYGDMSMEMAGDEITNAFKPWAERLQDEVHDRALLDQENINPFSPAFKINVSAETAAHHTAIEEEDDEEEEGDISMDVTKVVGGILRPRAPEPASSPLGDGTMDITQAVGKIHQSAVSEPKEFRSGQKRRRSTTDAGSPGTISPNVRKTRRRSSIARSSMGDESMDLTMAVGAIQNAEASPQKLNRRRSTGRRRSSGVLSEREDVTMDFTRPVGGIRAPKQALERLSMDSVDENEELTMELTTIMAGTVAAGIASSEVPTTPQQSVSNSMKAPGSTPTNQERFKHAPEEGPRKLLTPIFQKQSDRSPANSSSISRRKRSPSKSPAGATILKHVEEQERMVAVSTHEASNISTPQPAFVEGDVVYPDLLSLNASKGAPSAAEQQSIDLAKSRTPPSQHTAQNEVQLQPQELSPMVEKQLRSTPVKVAPSPQIQSASPMVERQSRSTPVQTAPSPRTRSAHREQSKTRQLKDHVAQISPVKAVTPVKQRSPQKPSTARSITSSRSRVAANRTPSPAKPETPLQHSIPPQLSPLLVQATPQSNLAPLEQDNSKHGTSQEFQAIADSIKLMSTPRKETLKAVTPRKQTSPLKKATPRTRPTPRLRTPVVPSAASLDDGLFEATAAPEPQRQVHLQEFLDEAGIRFMDLTTTKRRLTVAPTPSKARKAQLDDGDGEIEEPTITLESAVVAAACTEPELEMSRHACHELKRYIHEGKSDIKMLEAETYRETPTLIKAYMSAQPVEKAAIDAQLLAIKTHARLSSKEMWYHWRSQLLDELMNALQGIAEGLLKDDEILQRSEDILDQLLPGLVEEQAALQQETERLEASAQAYSEEEKMELEIARQHTERVSVELAEKRRILESLQQEVMEQEAHEEYLREAKEEATAAIDEAERVTEAYKSISTEELKTLQDSVRSLEETYGWNINSAFSSPTASVTMTYKSQLRLFFHPGAFLSPGSASPPSGKNSPISLTYVGSASPLPTTLRFFQQSLCAALHGFPQHSTRVSELLTLIRSCWDVALELTETVRCLAIEVPTDVRIVSDDRLLVSSVILLPAVKTKVRVNFGIQACVRELGLKLECAKDVEVSVVYGEAYNEANMSEFVKGRTGCLLQGAEEVVQDLRKKLIAKGPKGSRK